MGQVTQFLLQWLYLSSLTEDHEWLNYYYQPPHQHHQEQHHQSFWGQTPTTNSQHVQTHHQHPYSTIPNEQQTYPIQQQQQHYQQHASYSPRSFNADGYQRQDTTETLRLQQQHQQYTSTILNGSNNPNNVGNAHFRMGTRKALYEKTAINEWKSYIRQSLSQVPPGSTRLLTLEAERCRMVDELLQSLRNADDTMEQYRFWTHNPTAMKEKKSSRENKEKGDEREESPVDTFLRLQESRHYAKLLLRECRDYLPQIVSMLLHSPPSIAQWQHQQQVCVSANVDSIGRLRDLIYGRCLHDPNFGIELCWLLEAEVGRAWKSLFEHKQETGRRLIVILRRYELKKALEKIGLEKKTAWDLLQEVEQATAFGCLAMDEEGKNEVGEETGARCRHFGDTMNFIDQLTQVSLRLCRVRPLLRKQSLLDEMQEINRRLRRRMITFGEMSLDIDGDDGSDSKYYHDGNTRGRPVWPQIGDISSEDMLSYSVHFPMEPMCHVWPSGDHSGDDDDHTNKNIQGCVRVLHIVESECRLLSSRERCPFLVQMEVADTGLEGSDPQLYNVYPPQPQQQPSQEEEADDASSTTSLGAATDVPLPNTSSDMTTTTGHLSKNYHQDAKEEEYIDLENIVVDSSKNSLEESSITSTSIRHNDDNTNDVSAALVDKSSNCDSDDNNGSGSSDGTIPRGGDNEREGHESNNIDRDVNYRYQYDSIYNSNSNNEYVHREREIHELYLQQHREIPRQQQQQYPQQIHHQQQQAEQSPPPFVSQNDAEVDPSMMEGQNLLDQVFGMIWSDKCEQIRRTSIYGNVKGWRLASFLMKAGEDIRKEAMVMQVISKLRTWFESDLPESERPYLRPYAIMCVGAETGLLECLPDVKSLDEVKKECLGYTKLDDYFRRAYPTKSASEIAAQASGATGGGKYPIIKQAKTITFEQAQDNFLRSLVGYSLVCYILQIKDRHNANILLDRFGHLIHIDFGFVLGETPRMGKVPLFSERAPFKLTQDFKDVLGFNRSDGLCMKFLKMLETSFACASAHSEEIASMVEAAFLNLTRNNQRSRFVANGVRERLRMRGANGSKEQQLFIRDLMDSASSCWGTSTYDWLQKSMNGYQ